MNLKNLILKTQSWDIISLAPIEMKEIKWGGVIS
jgi:hypothetical protein